MNNKTHHKQCISGKACYGAKTNFGAFYLVRFFVGQQCYQTKPV